MEDNISEEEKVRRVLRELRKRDRSEEVENDIRTLERVLEDPIFRKQLSSRNSPESKVRRFRGERGDGGEGGENANGASSLNIETLRRDLEPTLTKDLGRNQKLLLTSLFPCDVLPVVLETAEPRPRLLVVGPRDIKSRTGGRLRIGDRVVAVAGRNEEVRSVRQEEVSSCSGGDLPRTSRLLEDLKNEFDSICDRAISNRQHIALALIREQTNMVLSGDWTQVELIRLSTVGGGLGFGIVGGTSTGVVVKTILPGSPADKDKRLRPGDHILQIGNVNTHGMSSQQVATVLRQQDPMVEMIVGRPINYAERPEDTPECWTMSTRAALNPTQLDEHLKDLKAANEELIGDEEGEEEQTGKVDGDERVSSAEGTDGQDTRSPETEKAASSNLTGNGSIACSSSAVAGSSSHDGSQPVSPTSTTERISLHSPTSPPANGLPQKRDSLRSNLSKGSSSSRDSRRPTTPKSPNPTTSRLASPLQVPSTSSPLSHSAQSHSISLKTLQEMALTVFLRENWESSGKFSTVDVVLSRDPALGLGITVAGYVHRKEEIGGVFVKSLVPKSAAAFCGKINVHDLILEVNGDSLEHLSHADSVRTLVKSGDRVTLRLIRFDEESPQTLCLQMLQQQETETQVIDVQSSNPDLVADWKKKLSSDVDIIQAVIRPDRKDAGDGGLGIALEGTVDVVGGAQLCPHHYIESIRRDGPAAKTGLLQAGDELLQVNHFPLYGESHVTVRQALTRAVQADAPVTLIIARRAQHLSVFMPRMERSLPLSYPLLASGSEQMVKAKSDICLSSSRENTEDLLAEVSKRLRSRSLEPLTGLAIWNCVPLVVWLEKDIRGLGFSIVDYRDPLHPSESVIVVQSLVPGGVAQADGRIVPGDRLLFVNDHDLSNSSLERAVAVLKAAPMGAVRLGIAKPVPIDQCRTSGHSPIISRTERFLAKGSSPRGRRRREPSTTHTSQETVWIGAEQYRRLHPQGYYPSRSPSAVRSGRSSLNGSLLSMASWSPCSSRSMSPAASPLSLRGSWAYDVIYLPAHLERNVKIVKGPLPLGIVLDSDRDKGVNGCIVKSVCGKKAIAKDGRIQAGDYIVKINNESLRNVTNSQARAILKRTNLIGTQCSVTYITSSDAKVWKERFHRDSEPNTPEISRLSPKVFPKFYKSPYMGGLAMESASERAESPQDTSEGFSLSEVHPLRSEEVKEDVDDKKSSIPKQHLANLIDGFVFDQFVIDLVQIALHDAILEIAISQKVSDWKGDQRQEKSSPSPPPPIPISPPPEEDLPSTSYLPTDLPSTLHRFDCRGTENIPRSRTVDHSEEPSTSEFSRDIDVESQEVPSIDRERISSVDRESLSAAETHSQSVKRESLREPEREDLENNNAEEEICERIESVGELNSPSTSSSSGEIVPPVSIAVHRVESLRRSSEESGSSEERQPEEIRQEEEEETIREEVSVRDRFEETQTAEESDRPSQSEPESEVIPSTPPTSCEPPSDDVMSRRGEFTSRTPSTGSDFATKPSSTSKSKFWGEARTVVLHREPNKSFGISIVGGRVEVSQKGGLPGTGNTVSGIFIKSVLSNSPAGRSAMMNMGDRVISVNEVDLREATHEQAVQAIKNAENPVRFVLQSLHSFSPQQQMISSSSTSTVGSIRIENRPDEAARTGDQTTKTMEQREITVIAETSTMENNTDTDKTNTPEEPVTSSTECARSPTKQNSVEKVEVAEDQRETSPSEEADKSVSSSPTSSSHSRASPLPPPPPAAHPRKESRDLKEIPLIVSDVSSSETHDSPLQVEDVLVEGVEESSAASVKREPTDFEVGSRFGYTQRKISTKYGFCDGEVLLFELRGVPEAGLGMSLAGNKDREKLSVFVVAVRPACPLPIKVGDELLEINGRVLTNMSHVAASSKIRDACESDYIELLVIRRFEAKKDMAINIDVAQVREDEEEEGSDTEGNEPDLPTAPNGETPSEQEPRERKWEKSFQMPPTTVDETTALHSVENVRKKSYAPAEKTAGIETGKETLIEIDKDGKGLGLSIVGGSDTVLGTVVIHEVYPDGAAAIDGRLKPGDQVLEVNNGSLRGVSHEKAISLLRRTPPKVRLLVYRDVNLQLSLLDPTQIYNIFDVELTKRPGRGLGLSIVGRKNEPGVYVSEVVKGGAAEADNRLMTGDQILSVNGADVANSMQEDVAAMLKACVGKVLLKVGRWKITETASRVHAAAEAALAKEKSPVKTATKSDEPSPSTSNCEDEKIPPPPAPSARPVITHTPPEGENVSDNGIHSGLSPVTEEPSSGTIDQRSIEGDRTITNSPNNGQIVEMLRELNEEGSETLLVELKKLPDQQLGMGIGKRTRGILVTSLQPGSSAAEKLRVGDRILAVNALPVTDQLSAVTFVKASSQRLFLQIARPRHAHA